MLTTPMVARFHTGLGSSSATETLKLPRSRSFRLRTTCRLSLSDCAASMWSSSVRKAIKGSFRFPVLTLRHWKLETRNWKPALSNHFRGNSLGRESFDHVADLDVSIIRYGNT